ncbi:MAG: NADPH-dependent oxidoreductase [Burkholderiaceae bacterium]
MHDLLSARYGEQAAVQIGAALDGAEQGALRQLLGHRSVRAYLDAPLDDSVLTTLVAAAQSAASSSNLQAWSVVAVTDAARKARLSEHAGNQVHIRQCPLFLVWLADLSRLDRVAERAAARAGASDYLEMFVLAVIDAALAAQNAVVAAESLGLGTVFIGGIRNRPEQVSAELRLPPHVFPVFGLCVGRPDPQRPASVKPRLPQSAVLHREIYSDAVEAEAVAGYDRALRVFQQTQDMAQVGWSAQASKRVSGPGQLSGRDRLKEALAALGFELR